MQLSNVTLAIEGQKADWNLKDVSLKPVARCFDVNLDGKKIECTFEYDESEWARLMKLLATVVRIEVSRPIPGVKKGEKITIHSSLHDRDITGTLYHIRKPYRHSEARVYFVRELPP